MNTNRVPAGIKQNKLIRRVQCSVCCGALLACGPLLGQTVNLEWLESGAMQRIGNYIPQKLNLKSAVPAGVKLPEGTSAPLYGELALGASATKVSYPVLIDEPAGKPSRIWIDSNHNGDFNDDPAPEWKARENSAGTRTTTMYMGGVTLPWPGAADRKMHLSLYRFDKTDPSRASFTNSLFYYRDYAWAGQVTLAGKDMSLLVSDDTARGSFASDSSTGKVSGVSLYIDINGDKRFESQGEMFNAAKPFNIRGTTYEIQGLDSAGGSLKFVKSDKTVAEVKLPPSVGDKAISFTHKSLDGRMVKFPDDYKGKLVMLDFWATWCGPCRAELPNLIKNYTAFHGPSFDVLGITLDNANMEKKVQSFLEENKMAWPQVYDGKGWGAEVGKLYSVHSIPNCLLVDGDSGIILATTSELRGPRLQPTLEKHLAGKKH